MQPLAMVLTLAVGWGLFGLSMWHRVGQLRAGAPSVQPRFDRLGHRLGLVAKTIAAPHKLLAHVGAGLAHHLIFLGFFILLARTVMLWGRGFVPGFNLWCLGAQPVWGLPLGDLYAFAKDLAVAAVLVGVVAFAYLRLIRRPSRMNLGLEGLAILLLIAILMVSDVVYDGAALALAPSVAAHCSVPSASSWCMPATGAVAHVGSRGAALAWHSYPEPLGGTVALMLKGVPPAVLLVLLQLGFWTHSVLVLVFLNVLPYSKHFHVVTALPNVFLTDLAPARLPALAASSEALLELVDEAAQFDDPGDAALGLGRLPHLTWKDRLDLLTCTECGRCSARCPATTTGKSLNPMRLTLDLREHLVRGQPTSDLVPEVVAPPVVWACTTCRACEEECPVGVTYVDKIVGLRRSLVMVRGEQVPRELAKAFEGVEAHGNPWGMLARERMRWVSDLAVPTFAQRPQAQVLLWVGCAAAYDPQAARAARALVGLLQAAQVDFAVLGEEESCTGDFARRAGNEFLFASQAEKNVATIEKYRAQGGVRRIVTACPHCHSTLSNEYPQFGGDYEVVHHTQLLEELVAQRRLRPLETVAARIAFHDPCYLGRYGGIYEAPRRVLRGVAGVELVEVSGWSRRRALCCGAGGGQAWLEEQNRDRMHVKRTSQLVGTGADVVATSCPFCSTMLSDGLKALDRDGGIATRDVAEVLAEACGVGGRP